MKTIRLTDELLADEKEKAEHVMLVDLARNDMGRVSASLEAVKVTDFMKIQYYSHVMHIVSLVEGRKKGTYFIHLIWWHPFFRQEHSAEHRRFVPWRLSMNWRRVRRGLYGGATGYVDFSGDMDFCITIRTMIKKGENVYICRPAPESSQIPFRKMSIRNAVIK